MSFQDKTIKCRDCAKDFVFSAGEQQFFAEKGFDKPPIRCSECRKAKRQNRGEAKPQMPVEEGTFTIKCKKCAKSMEVPFRPKFPDEIYCSECFQTEKPSA